MRKHLAKLNQRETKNFQLVLAKRC